MFTVSRLPEQLRLRSQESIVATTEDSVLRTEMTGLSLRKRMPPNVSSKFQIDSLGDHFSTCVSHSGVKKDHDWVVDQIDDLFRTTHKVKTQ